MSNHFIVTTTSDTPTLRVSQQPLEEVLRAMRAYPYSHTHRSFVYETRLLPNVGGHAESEPSGCGQLCLVGVIEPVDEVENYTYYAASALDKLPPEQALQRIQIALDLFEKAKIRIEGRAKEVIPTGSC